MNIFKITIACGGWFEVGDGEECSEETATAWYQNPGMICRSSCEQMINYGSWSYIASLPRSSTSVIFGLRGFSLDNKALMIGMQSIFKLLF